MNRATRAITDAKILMMTGTGVNRRRMAGAFRRQRMLQSSGRTEAILGLLDKHAKLAAVGSVERGTRILRVIHGRDARAIFAN